MKKGSPRKGSGAREKHLTLLDFFIGRVTLSCAEEDVTSLLNLCLSASITYGTPVRSDDGRFSISLSYSSAKRLRAFCSEKGIEVATERSRGIREAVRFLVSRPGLPVGILLSVVIAVVSSTHLWEIRVTGNGTLSKSEVISELSSAGLSLFDYVPQIDVDSIENRLLIDSERISWITINLIGNVAEVQIREKTAPQDEEDAAPANLVATRDGVIVSVESFRGNVLVKKGQAVREGEVLVSGVYDSVTEGIRYTRAEGRILAETERTLEIRIPYRYERETRGEAAGRRYTLRLFGKERILYEGDGYDDAHSSERITYLSVFGKALPIGLSVETSYSVESETGEYTHERAMELAYYRLREELLSLPEIEGVLEKRLSYDVGEDAYTLYCTVRCIENIAKTQNIEVKLFE